MSIIEWTQNSLDFLDKLDKKDSERIVKKIDTIKENPIRFIKIRSIKHRKNAYKI